MADITDPLIIRSLTHRWRIRAEQLVALQILLNNDATDYSQNIALGSYANEDVVVDGRQSEGVAQVSKADVTSLLGLLNTVRQELVAAGVPEMLEKFSVREPRVQLTQA